ncbi:hypothetical protein AV530_005070 [Patagioenas fasciata monilis]|uniref:Uncharacterized protein n=1 Tax=Patagioenas fasciata monilis TaxID=372326 RepID=A0A1V4K3W7_PATFA|nr:hypothetical protein AV530_005070 [Patagioenas fasciata monilis]
MHKSFLHSRSLFDIALSCVHVGYEDVTLLVSKCVGCQIPALAEGEKPYGDVNTFQDYHLWFLQMDFFVLETSGRAAYCCGKIPASSNLLHGSLSPEQKIMSLH